MPGVDDMIGSYTIILAHNVAFDWDQMTLDFLRALQNDLARIDGHSLVALREILVPDVASLFRTILDFYSFATSNDKFHTQASHTDHDLAFLVRTIGSEEIEIEARFASASMSEPEIEIFLDHFGSAFESIPQNLTSALRDVNLVSSKEKQRIIVKMNPAYPFGTSLSPANNMTELIEEQARKTPQRIAVRD
jgi:hypothetical protein